MTKHKKKFLKILKKYFRGCPDDNIHQALTNLGVISNASIDSDSSDKQTLEEMYEYIKKQAIPCNNCGEPKVGQ